MFTVVPASKDRSKVSPAGTVNALMFTVVHLTAAETSLKDEIIPVHAVLVAAALTVTTIKQAASKVLNVEENIVNSQWESSMGMKVS